MSDYGVSVLYLGYLIYFWFEGGKLCGEGFELCIDEYGVVCVVKGLLLSIEE